MHVRIDVYFRSPHIAPLVIVSAPLRDKKPSVLNLPAYTAAAPPTAARDGNY